MTFQKQWIEDRGITVIRKLDPERRKGRRSKVSLVQAGGAVSGGAYKLGGLRALDDVLVSRTDGRVSRPFTVNDFDSYVGLSAGAIFASAISAGITTRELFEILEGTSRTFENFRAGHFLRPNVTEGFNRLDMTVRKQAEVWASYLRGLENPRTEAPYSLPETLNKTLSVLMRLLPTGLFSAWGLESFLRKNLQVTGLPNHFVRAYEQTGKELHLTAVDINNGRKIVFGHDQPYRDVPITQAVIASCGVPGWFRTVRIANPRYGHKGERRYLDLTDGGVVRTANVKTAIDTGADLVVCYNPFRAIHYENVERSLYEHGAYALVSQLFRILLGTRLDLSRQWFFNDPDIECDLIYIEPPEDDYVFFLMNPFDVWVRRKAAEQGYQAVRESIDTNFPVLRRVFSDHGITIGRRHHGTPASTRLSDPTPGEEIRAAVRSVG